MASVFVLLEAFNRKEAAALGFFPCATASILYNMLYDCADYLRLIARVRVYNFSLVGH